MDGKTIITKNMTVVMSDAFSHLSDFLVTVPDRLDGGEGKLMHDGRNQIRLLTHGGEDFVVKRYKRANLPQRFAYSFFRPTKARRAYCFAALMRQRGIDTPQEVAYMERRSGGLFTTGYFVCLPAKGTTVIDILRSDSDFDKAVATDLAAFIVTMHSRGVLHGDMNLANFIMTTDSDGKRRFAVVDTNRSHFTDGLPTREECLDNLHTLTHQRAVFRFVVERYAELRSWDVKATVDDAIAYLDAFENRRKRHDNMKRMFRI